jgi:hypothetical protein
VLVDLLVDEVLDRRSVALVPPRDGIDEPQALGHTNGSSVYTVAGADIATDPRRGTRLALGAGRRDGSVVDESAVDLVSHAIRLSPDTSPTTESFLPSSTAPWMPAPVVRRLSQDIWELTTRPLGRPGRAGARGDTVETGSNAFAITPSEAASCSMNITRPDPINRFL